MADIDSPAGPTRTSVTKSDQFAWLGAAYRAGLIGFVRPTGLATAVRAPRAYGPIGAATTVSAVRFGDRPAVLDDRGSVTFRQLDAAVNAIANHWISAGLDHRSRVGILCRNHRGFFLALFAAAKIGARTVLLNTELAASQLRDITAAQSVTALVYDAEFAAAADGLALPDGTWTAWSDDGDSALDLLTRGDSSPPPPAAGHGGMTILSSGTTGRPKGVDRAAHTPNGLALPGGILGRIPLRSGERMVVGPPLFHGYGLVFAMLGISLGCTIVLRRRFDVSRTLADLSEQRATSAFLVPTMLSRILDVGDRTGFALPDLRILTVGGGPLSHDLAARARDVFGDVLYNFYGSTEASCIAIADPEDLRAAPGCVGRAPRGVEISIVDDEGRQVAPGVTGNIVMAGPAAAEPLRLGDIGHFDTGGRLFVDGRADDMIVSGGENVYPGEVEELLAKHPAIRESAVVGVADSDFGQRLRAFIVCAEPEGITADEVRNYVAGNLARYKVPRDVVIVDELPRTATGKVLKRLLMDQDPSSARDRVE